MWVKIRVLSRMLRKASLKGTIWAETWRGEGASSVDIWGKIPPGWQNSSCTWCVCLAFWGNSDEVAIMPGLWQKAVGEGSMTLQGPWLFCLPIFLKIGNYPSLLTLSFSFFFFLLSLSHQVLLIPTPILLSHLTSSFSLPLPQFRPFSLVTQLIGC